MAGGGGSGRAFFMGPAASDDETATAWDGFAVGIGFSRCLHAVRLGRHSDPRGEGGIFNGQATCPSAGDGGHLLGSDVLAGSFGALSTHRVYSCLAGRHSTPRCCAARLRHALAFGRARTASPPGVLGMHALGIPRSTRCWMLSRLVTVTWGDWALRRATARYLIFACRSRHARLLSSACRSTSTCTRTRTEHSS